MKQRPAGFVILMSVIVLSLKIISRRLNVLHECEDRHCLWELVTSRIAQDSSAPVGWHVPTQYNGQGILEPHFEMVVTGSWK